MLGRAVWSAIDSAVLRRGLRMGLLTLVLTALLLVVLAWFFQRRLIYIPSTGPVELPSRQGWAGLSEVELKTADGLTLKAWFLRGRRAGTLLWLHGNAGDRGDRLGVLTDLRERGWGVLLPDYRGYGGSEGSPSEAGLRLDAEAGLAWLRTHAPGPVVYVGSSIGAGVAVDLAARQSPAGLILLSPFTSLVDLGRVHYPWLPMGLFLRDRYENKQKIGGIRCPLLVIHGDRDRIVPLKLGRTLFEAANEPKAWLPIEGAGHNDLSYVDPPRYWGAIDAFLEGCLGEP